METEKERESELECEIRKDLRIESDSEKVEKVKNIWRDEEESK